MACAAAGSIAGRVHKSLAKFDFTALSVLSYASSDYEIFYCAGLDFLWDLFEIVGWMNERGVF